MDQGTNTSGAANEGATPNTNTSTPPEFDAKFPHLRKEAAELLEKTRAERCEYIRQDRFILHPHARNVLTAMKDVLLRPKGIRPPCLAVIGGSNEGKSTIVRRFHADYEQDAVQDAAGNHDKIRILVVEMPPRATEPRICLAIARALGLPGYGTTKARILSDNVLRALVAKQVEMIIFNEAQHAWHLNSLERSVACDLLKCISNLGISVVAVGTPELIDLFAVDPQIANRMRVVRLVSFANKADLTDFLHTLESHYPLPEASSLGAKTIRDEIYKRTNGITGEVVELCNAAAVHAVNTGAPKITLELLRKTRVFPAADSVAA